MDVDRVHRLGQLVSGLEILLSELKSIVEIEGLAEDDPAPIDHLAIGVRAYNALNNDNVKTVGQLRALSDTELLRTPGLGRKSLAEIRDALRFYDEHIMSEGR